MHDTMLTSWAVLLGLGAFHGINPAMGWLFAVALGMQERQRGAVLRALLPLGVGHALAVAAAVAVAVAIGTVIPMAYLRWLVATTLIIFGLLRLARHRHPRWVSMQVSMAGLTLWSFLMASAHGAGLMVVPVFIGIAMVGRHHAHHAMTSPGLALLATAAHAIGYLVVTAAVAVFVFDKVGIGILRKAWFNLDYFWAGALIATGGLTLIL
jgi:hypothetical protein